MKTDKKDQGAFGIVGVGVAACAACCAVPILAFLAAGGLLTVGSLALFGAVGLLVLVPASLWYARRRQQAGTCAVPEDGSVPVELGRRS